MMNFWHAIEWFVYGAIVGYFAHPVWQLLTKIVEEAKEYRYKEKYFI